MAVAREVADRLLVVATYTDEDYTVLYVDEGVRGHYESENVLETVGDRLHRYGQLDFFERGVFADLVPEAERVGAFATFTDAGTIVRVVTDADEGLYLSVAPGTDVTALVAALEPVVAGGNEAPEPDRDGGAQSGKK
jgi:hypothetical protein